MERRRYEVTGEGVKNILRGVDRGKARREIPISGSASAKFYVITVPVQLEMEKRSLVKITERTHEEA